MQDLRQWGSTWTGLQQVPVNLVSQIMNAGYTAPVTVELKLQAGHKQPDDQPGDQLSGTLPVLHSSSPVHGSM